MEGEQVLSLSHVAKERGNTRLRTLGCASITFPAVASGTSFARRNLLDANAVAHVPAIMKGLVQAFLVRTWEVLMLRTFVFAILLCAGQTGEV